MGNQPNSKAEIEEPESLKQLRKSFANLYNGPDPLRREYELARLVEEAERYNLPIDTYRRLFDIYCQSKEPIPDYPKFVWQQWREVVPNWLRWITDLPNKTKRALLWKIIVKLVQSGVLITAAIAVGRYLIEAPARQKQSHYQAWLIINSAQGQKGSGGRIEALESLTKDGVSLARLNADNAVLAEINLRQADLTGANLQQTNLRGADLRGANLQGVNLEGADLEGADLREAKLQRANLKRAYLKGVNLSRASLNLAHLQETYLEQVNFQDANLTQANLAGANLQEANLMGAYLQGADLTKNLGLTLEQVKAAKYWEYATYDPGFRQPKNLPSKPRGGDGISNSTP